MADLARKYKSLYSSTTNSFGTGTSVTITPNSVVGLPTDTEITLTFDRVNSSGTATPSLMERIKGTISGSNFVVSTGGRGYDGTTEQAHTSPVVEMVWNAKDWNDLVDALVAEHTQAGGLHTKGMTNASLVTPTITSPKVITSINDTNANELFKVTATASAVNEITVANAATGNAPTLSATGGDTNIDLTFAGKGTGKVRQDARYGTITADTDGATITFNMATSNFHSVTLGGNRTLAVSNVSVGQTFILRLLQDGTGSRTVTWFSTIKWAGGSAPTLTTTASKADILGFLCTSAGNYDGFVVGQNI
jgi:hypothetical protein